MTKAVFRRMALPQGDVLVPSDDDGRELVASLKSAKDVMVDVHSPRNGRHHRLYFHLSRRIIESGAWDGDEDALLEWMKYATGHVRTVVDHRGRPQIVPRSIAFESMDQAAFTRWFNRVLFVICDRLLGDTDWRTLRDEIVEAVDGRFEAQRRAA